jgi:hypothetical protein
MESTGRLNQDQWILGLDNRGAEGHSLFLRYFFGHARSDTDGVDTFPADSYDLRSEYGRASIDVRHRLAAGGTISLPRGLRLSPLVFLGSGRPFDITAGRDVNHDSVFTDRPALAVDARQSGVIGTSYGLLDPSPSAHERIVARNLGAGPRFAVVNLRLSKTVRLPGQRGEGPVKEKERKKPSKKGALGGKTGRRSGDLEGGRGLTFSLSAQNLFNHVNPAPPVGSLGSPVFGRSLASAGGYGFGTGASGGGNRRIELQLRLVY